MTQNSPTPFDHVGYRKLTESLRKADKRERDKSVIGFCEEVALLKVCRDDLVVLRGALSELVDLLADPEFFALALDRGRAATEWYIPDQPDTSVQGLLISTEELPGAPLASLLEANGFPCVSAVDARPFIYIGKGNFAAFKRGIRSGEKVVRYDPPGGVVGGRRLDHSAGESSGGRHVGSGPANPETKPSSTPQKVALSERELAPVPDASVVAVPPVEPENVNRYRIAAVDRPDGQTALPTTPVEVLARLVEAIVSVEGPMDEDLVACRVRSAYGQSSIRKSGRKKVADVLKNLVRRERLDQDDAGFYTTHGSIVVARSRTGIADDLVRATAHLPPLEVRAALAEVGRDRPDLAGRDLVIEAAAQLGFRLSGGQVTNSPLGILIADQLARLDGDRDAGTSDDAVPSADGGAGLDLDDLQKAA